MILPEGCIRRVSDGEPALVPMWRQVDGYAGGCIFAGETPILVAHGDDIVAFKMAAMSIICRWDEDPVDGRQINIWLCTPNGDEDLNLFAERIDPAWRQGFWSAVHRR